MGRPSGVVKGYLLNNGQADKDGYVHCGAEGCAHKMKHSQFQASKWADHIVIDCAFTSSAVKQIVAEAHQTDRIKTKYDPLKDTSQEADIPGSSTGKRKATDSAEVLEARTAKLLQRTDFCDGKRAVAITEAITKCMVGNAWSFRVVNTGFFIDMIKALNVAYVAHLPKSDTFARKWVPDLFSDTVKKLANMWKNLGNPLLTLGFDGFKTEAGGHVVNVTETSGDKCAFKNCVDPGQERENAEFYAKLVEDELIAGAKARNLPVEDVYAGVVADNVCYNRSALTTLSVKYPKLLMFGCVVHLFDLACEDLAKITELGVLIQQTKTLVLFVRNHKYVKVAFKQRIGPKGKMLLTYPETRFAYSYLMIHSVIINRINLRDMIDGATWTEISAGIDAKLVEKFTSIVNDEVFFKKLEVMHEVLEPISKIIHHLESCGARASWVFPLAVSYVQHTMEWRSKPSTTRYLHAQTVAAVLGSFVNRWEGCGQLVAIKNKAHTLAYMTDPFTVPALESAPPGWQKECTDVLTIYFPVKTELDQCLTELNDFVLRVGPMGEIITRKRGLVTLEPAEEAKFNRVEKTIAVQKKMTDTIREWQVTGRQQFPKLAQVAERLAVVSVQSADVERVCKAHKVIHTKARNRLHTRTVQMLLFTYVNLRLLNKCTEELGDFITDALEVLGEEGLVRGTVAEQREEEIVVLHDSDDDAPSQPSIPDTLPETVDFEEYSRKYHAEHGASITPLSAGF
jgi:hypothetical protein